MNKAILALFIILLFPYFCFAEDIYISQSSSGSNSGTNCADAHSVAWFNDAANWGDGNGIIGPVDIVRLCDTFSTPLTIQGSGTVGAPITVYFEKNAKLSAPYWPKSGAISVSKKDYIIIDGGTNGIIEATDNGTALSNQEDSRGVVFNGNHIEVKNLQISNMYQRTPGSTDSSRGGYAVYGSGSYAQIHNCIIDNAQTGISFSYPGSTTQTDIMIYNNKITSASGGITIGSGNTDAIARRVKVYNNEIVLGNVWGGYWTPPPGDGHFHNDGIHMWAVHTDSLLDDVEVYNNTVGPDMGWYEKDGKIYSNTTGWIYLEGNISNTVVYNNLLTADSPSYPTNGFVYLKRGQNTEVYNNTIVSWGSGIGISATTDGIVNLRNNLMHDISTGITIALTNTVSHVDYNSYYFSNGIKMATIGDRGTSSFFYDFNQWQLAMRFDQHSIIGDQLLNSQYKLTNNSPVKDAGISLTDYFSTDKDGVSRPQGTAWDIGAYEYETFSPAHPRNLTLQ